MKKDFEKFLTTQIKALINDTMTVSRQILCEEKFTKKLNEGLIKSQPLDSARRMLNMFLSKINGLKYKIIIDDTVIIMSIYNTTTIKEISIIVTYITNLGYFPSFYTMSRGQKLEYNRKYSIDQLSDDLVNNKQFDYIEFRLEAKYDKQLLVIPKIGYHVTRKILCPKISHIGLIPKALKSEHPERIYITYTLEDAINLRNQLEIQYLLDDEKDEYIILSVDLTEYQKLKAYIDPNFLNKGFYTYTNIKPLALKIINL